MEAAVRVRTTVQPGGRIEISRPELASGTAVDVIVLVSDDLHSEQRHAADIIAEAPGHRQFTTARDVDDCLRQEREAWH
jgi:hypothetical protein